MLPTNEQVKSADTIVTAIQKHGFTNLFAILSAGLLMWIAFQSVAVIQKNTAAINGLSQITETNSEAIDDLKTEIKSLRSFSTKLRD